MAGGMPPFFRGSAAEGAMDVCDRLLYSGNCCDALADYAVTWHPVAEYDGDSIPVSGVCHKHVVLVDRSLVRVMETHPLRRAS
jgi:hypothetical protein